MQLKTLWQQSSSNPENADNFAIISQWWASLNGKEINWGQRLIPPDGDVSKLNWEPQQFDEVFIISNPQIRGITLYWFKPGSRQERNTTPHKLELDNLHQQIYIYPQSQKELVIRVKLPQIIYQTIEIKNPQIELTALGENKLLTLRDEQQQLQVKVTLSPLDIDKLKEQIS